MQVGFFSKEYQQHTYHQWVPFFLGAAAILCLFPHVIWRMLSGFLWLDAHALVQTVADNQRQNAAGRHVLLRDSALMLQAGLKGGNWVLTAAATGRKLLAFVTCVVQLVLIAVLFKPQLSAAGEEKEETKEEEKDYNASLPLPEQFLCDVGIRQLDSVQRFTFECTMPLAQVRTHLSVRTFRCSFTDSALRCTMAQVRTHLSVRTFRCSFTDSALFCTIAQVRTHLVRASRCSFTDSALCCTIAQVRTHLVRTFRCSFTNSAFRCTMTQICTHIVRTSLCSSMLLVAWHWQSFWHSYVRRGSAAVFYTGVLVVVPASAAALFSSLHDASVIGLYPCCSYLSRCSSVHHVASAIGLYLCCSYLSRCSFMHHVVHATGLYPCCSCHRFVYLLLVPLSLQLYAPCCSCHRFVPMLLVP